jgi:CRISPR-associated exonuclease Cas4
MADADLLPISALQHLLFCRRQCALIHVERLWAENQFTIQGRQLHDKAHGGRGESRPGVRIARGLQLRSLRLGLYGVADVVEFPADGPPLPIEYKRGRPKKNGADRVQLCAQALCLEEMLDTAIPEGALYYGKIRQRVAVPFDDALRQLTAHTIADLHQLVASGVTPSARREKKCGRCSLLNLCMPDVLEGSESASRYLRRSLSAAQSPAPSLATGNQQLATERS